MKRAWMRGLVGLLLAAAPAAFAEDDAIRARDLAQEFNVSSSQLMDIKQNQELGWDEIRTSLLVAQHSGASLDEVVRLKKSGMSFDDISSRYNLKLDEIEAKHIEGGKKADVRDAPASKRVHKKAARLADEYEVSSDEVMRLHERGLGWKEIRHALFIAERAGRPINEIVGLKESGMDWDDIAGRYQVDLKDERSRTKERRGEGGVFREAPASQRERAAPEEPAKTGPGPAETGPGQDPGDATY